MSQSAWHKGGGERRKSRKDASPKRARSEGGPLAPGDAEAETDASEPLEDAGQGGTVEALLPADVGHAGEAASQGGEWGEILARHGATETAAEDQDDDVLMEEEHRTEAARVGAYEEDRASGADTPGDTAGQTEATVVTDEDEPAMQDEAETDEDEPAIEDEPAMQDEAETDEDEPAMQDEAETDATGVPAMQDDAETDEDEPAVQDDAETDEDEPAVQDDAETDATGVPDEDGRTIRGILAKRRTARTREEEQEPQVQQMLFDPSEIYAAAGVKDENRPRYRVSPRNIRITGILIPASAAVALASATLGADITPAALPRDLLPPSTVPYLASAAAVAAAISWRHVGRGDATAAWVSLGAAALLWTAAAPVALALALPAAALMRSREAREWLI